MTQKILKMLKSENNFISGEKIAKTLNISRTGVWKNIKKLKDMGYNIISTTNKGYLLVDDNHLFNKLEIEKEITTTYLGKKVYFFDEITSTNDYAKQLANNNLEEGTIVVANCQTEGRGRLDRHWVSDKNEGIFLSLILRPNIELFNLIQITLLAGICVCNTIKFFTGIDTKIKWPNDIIINNKKVCGILTEVSAQIENVSYSILGIGINVNNKNFEGYLKDKATSIFLETNKFINRQEIIGHFLKEFEDKYFIYKKEKDFTIFLEEYKSLCINLQKKAKVKYKEKELIGDVIDISNLGELVLKTEEGILKISSGEVSLRNIYGEYI